MALQDNHIRRIGRSLSCSLRRRTTYCGSSLRVLGVNPESPRTFWGQPCSNAASDKKVGKMFLCEINRLVGCGPGADCRHETYGMVAPFETSQNAEEPY